MWWRKWRSSVWPTPWQRSSICSSAATNISTRPCLGRWQKIRSRKKDYPQFFIIWWRALPSVLPCWLRLCRKLQSGFLNSWILPREPWTSWKCSVFTSPATRLWKNRRFSLRDWMWKRFSTRWKKCMRQEPRVKASRKQRKSLWSISRTRKRSHLRILRKCSSRWERSSPAKLWRSPESFSVPRWRSAAR